VVIEYKTVKLSELHEDPANARLHPDENLADIRASLKEFGQVEPLVVQKSTGKVIGGNGRLKVMRSLGWEECDVALVDLSDMKATALGITLNRAGERAEWDTKVLAQLMEGLDGLNDELEKSLQELEKECKIDEDPAGDADAEPQIDKAAELQKKWQTAQGQLWLIGDHRLMCGDSTKREDVERLMQGEKAELLFTSPPYSDQRDYENANVDVLTLAGIFSTWKESRYFAVNLGLQQKDGEVDCYWDEWILTAKSAGHKFLAWNVWDKVNATSVRSQNLMFARQHEWIFVFGDEPKELNRIWEKSAESKKREAYYSVNEKGQKVTTRRQKDGTVKETPIGEIFDNKNLGSVVTVFAEMSREITSHPAMFPPTLPSIYVEAMTIKGQVVCEPFAGSGTTLVACQNLNRKCYGIEISPSYCAVILERMKTAFPTLEIRLAE